MLRQQGAGRPGPRDQGAQHSTGRVPGLYYSILYHDAMAKTGQGHRLWSLGTSIRGRLNLVVQRPREQR
eukprot:5375826-Heterocapsa_arctica.AAC.1